MLHETTLLIRPTLLFLLTYLSHSQRRRDLFSILGSNSGARTVVAPDLISQYEMNGQTSPQPGWGDPSTYLPPRPLHAYSRPPKNGHSAVHPLVARNVLK